MKHQERVDRVAAARQFARGLNVDRYARGLGVLAPFEAWVWAEHLVALVRYIEVLEQKISTKKK
jgi:hypothetical protein